MLKVIDDEGTIRRCQRHLTRSLQPLSDAMLTVRLGHPGASFPARVSWSERLGIWFCLRKLTKNRYWNAFGVQRPGGSAALSITCEINFPLRGIDRKMGGALAEDRSGRIFVVHRGRIGGGKRGIGKSLFEENFGGTWTTMQDGERETSVALIGMLKSPRFPRQVGQFIRKVGTVKQQASSPASLQVEIFKDTGPKEEFMGKGIAAAADDLAGLCDRGLVVKDLAVLLAGRGYRVANDTRRDLFVVDDRGQVQALFRIRTELSDASLYSGMAQLWLDSVDLTEQPTHFLVLPVQPHADLMDKLKRLNIEVISYTWESDRAVFPGLDLLLPPPLC